MSGAVPELRFPEFPGAWKAGHAGDAFAKGTAKGSAGLPVYSVTMDRGLVPRDSLERHMADDAADGTNLRAEPNDIVYNTMRMWQGAAGVADTACMVSPAYVVLRPKKGTVSAFFGQRFGNSKMLHSLWAYSHGLTNDRLRLYFNDFAQIPVHIPSSAEQQKIADFLGTVDAKLDALRRKKSGLEAFKSGLMQRLFSQELRFTRDDGTDFPDWVEKTLGQMGETFGGLSGKSGEDFGSGLPFVTYRQIFEASTVDFSKCGMVRILHGERQNRVNKGDVLITSSSETPEEVGFASVALDVPGEVYLNSFAFGFRGGASLLPEFSRYLFRSPPYRMAVVQLAQGSTRFNISKAGFLKIALSVPHPDEQRKIADALSAMDAKIAAVADQITHMETFKKGLLQQMFV